jgi:hypothetical protein
MADRPELPMPDKNRLIGGCALLPLRLDSARLAAEVNALGPGVWGTRGGRVGVHAAAEAVFLRGHAPAEGDLPIEDRPALDALPAVREVLALLGGQPRRCLLARLPPGAIVAPHVDRGAYFAAAVRLHVPVVTSDRVFMYCAGLSYRMGAGEAWALNNGAAHGVWNADPVRARTHLICDFLPTPALLDLLARADRGRGEDLPEVRERLGGPPP